MPPDNKSLIERTDDFMVEILKKVRHTGDGVDVRTQIDFFKEMVKWAGVKNKIAPEGEEGSKIDEYRNALKISGSGGGDRDHRSSEKPTKTPKIKKTEETDDSTPRSVPAGFGGLTGSKQHISPTHGPFSVANGSGGAGGFGGSGSVDTEIGGGGNL